MKLLCLLLFGGMGGTAHAQTHPNVVVFLADDAGWGDYSRNGNTQVATPNIDSLAQDGVTLDRFFVCPVCSPTRAEFLTGRYHPRTGVYGVSTGQERMNLNETTIAQAFHSAGYATGAFGKWHNGSQWPYHPMARGFDEFYGYTAGHWGEYVDPPLEHNGQPVRGKGYIVDLCTDQAIDFIDRNRAKPFFCYVPFTTPHSPWAIPDEDWQRFREKPITQRGALPKQEDIDETRCALAMLENQDRNVGRVLKRLDDLQLRENTIVVYFSDNGPNTPRWNDGMKGRKGSTDEGGVRSTCFIRWPATLPRGRTVSLIAGAIDLLPTLTSLAGVPTLPEQAAGNPALPLDGIDLSPDLAGTGTLVGNRFLYSTWARQVSVRSQQYRLDAKGELFDMIADPGQQNPITKEQPQVVAQMQAAADAWRQTMFPNGDQGGRLGPGVDPRPIPVGYREFPRTSLPARDGEPQGSVKRSASAPNSSYFVNWKSKEDRLSWKIQVQTAGRYRVELLYTCPVADAGSTVELSFRGAQTTGKVTPGWDPPLYTNQDTLPRPPAESKMKEFRTLPLDPIDLPAGEGSLELRATEIPGGSVMNLRELVLTLQ
jgi:arylsulfatase A-like enzyme